MRVTFPIIWVEDKKVMFNASKVSVEQYLSGKGFIPRLEHLKDPKDVLDSVNSLQPHVILVDYELGKGKKNGREVIADIRSSLKYVNILFYSANPTNLDVEHIDGVFKHRGKKNVDDKLIDLIDISLKHIENPWNMRGIFIAESADLERLLEEILNKHFAKGDVFGEGGTLDFCSVRPVFATKISAVKRVLKEVVDECRARNYSKKRLKFESFQTCFNTFDNEVRSVRNAFAHAREKRDSNGVVNLIWRTGDVIDAQFCEDQRKKLALHRENLESILSEL